MKEIVQEGTPVLCEVAQSVPEELFESVELAHIIKDMEEALEKEPDGVALAAPQIAIPYRIFIVRNDRTVPEPKKVPEVEVYINPEIIKTSRKRATMDEGCLSVRGVYGTTHRHERATVRARRIDGSKFERGGSGLMAQIFEHETDHLNGILFIDHAEHLIRIPHGPIRRFAYFGTPQVASETLETLIKHGFVPVVVVTSPDAPSGRGLTLTPSATKTLALAHDIPVLTPHTLDAEALAAIQAYDCDYAIVVAYGKIFPENLIAAYPSGVLNVHYSLLPKYRGATPLEGSLLAGETKTGVTIQKMVKELDAGDIIAQKATEIASDETALELRPRLIALGAALLVETLPAYLQGDIAPIPQNQTLVTLTRKLKKEAGLISLEDSAETNWNKYRAYADSIGTYFFENGKRMKITKASLRAGHFVVERVIPEGKRETNYTGGKA